MIDCSPPKRADVKKAEGTDAPMHVEQWLDFVIASAAHRSHDEPHRRFGDLLIQRYFVALPERYHEDKVASAYFDDMLCVVASAVRGFSVVRDVFQTNWDSLRTAKEKEVQRAERLDAFSPLKKDGHWGKVMGALSSVGIAALLTAALKTRLASLPLVVLVSLTLGVSIGLMGLEGLTDWWRGRRMRAVEKQFPEDLLAYWQEQTLSGYREVAKQFLPLAMEVSERHYPSGQWQGLSEDQIADMVERHFAFKQQTRRPAL